MTAPKAWRLRTSLAWVLTAIFSVSFVAVGSVLFLVRAPQIDLETRKLLQTESADLAQGTEALLAALQTQIELIASTLALVPDSGLQAVIEHAVADTSAFQAIYQVSADGTVLRAAVNSRVGVGRRAELLGNDLSRHFLVQRVRETGAPVWSDKHHSPISGVISVAVGVPSGDSVIVGEMPLAQVLKSLRIAGGKRHARVWVIDQRGEILADDEDSARVGVANLANQPLLASLGDSAAGIGQVSFEGEVFDAAVAHSRLLDWYFVVRSPSGLNNPQIAATIEFGVAALVSSIVFGLVLSPLWATYLARPISSITERARRIAAGTTLGPWPRSRTIELNQLSADLERMAEAVRDRERALGVIFDASPVGIGLLEPASNFSFVRVNDALLQLLGYQREQLLGRNGLDLGLWCDLSVRRSLYDLLQAEGYGEVEGWLKRRDGSIVLAAISARTLVIGNRPQTIWVAKDITHIRRIEDEVRTLNAELEERVRQRTEELRFANAELAATVEQLQLARDELVRTEKLASLGSLVAGIAHELNTPIGNGVMAVTTMRARLTDFEEQTRAGVRRSDLDRLLAAVDTGTDIAVRNLGRAADLVTSFKQVAVDQASSQRRPFDLGEVAREILLTLQPVLKHRAVAVKVSIAGGIVLDSYPGPLGQVITNLIDNAVVHAFADDQKAEVAISADNSVPGRVVVEVADNGKGIATSLLPRIFDPFVTTRMGRGGTGLGLHIAHNIVVSVLGGTIAVDSTPGRGTRFTIDIPLTAPVPERRDDASSAARGTTGMREQSAAWPGDGSLPAGG